jgi:hypothetical protein
VSDFSFLRESKATSRMPPRRSSIPWAIIVGWTTTAILTFVIGFFGGRELLKYQIRSAMQEAAGPLFSASEHRGASATNADKDSFPGFTVTIGEAGMGKVKLQDYDGRIGSSSEEAFYINVQVSNPSPTNKHYYCGASNSRGNAILVDEFGNEYTRITSSYGSKIVGQIDGEDLMPGKAIDDLYVFKLPFEKAKKLRFTIPAESIGSKKDKVMEFDLSKLKRPELK